jgi:hypothetical protein
MRRNWSGACRNPDRIGFPAWSQYRLDEPGISNRIASVSFPGEVHRGGDDRADANDPVWASAPFEDDAEVVADLQVPTHVDPVLVDVGELSRQLGTGRRREKLGRPDIHRFVQVGTDATPDDQCVDGPGQPLLFPDPPRVSALDCEIPVHVELEDDLRWHGIFVESGHSDGHPGADPPGIEPRSRAKRSQGVGPRQSVAGEQRGQRLATAQRVRLTHPDRAHLGRRQPRDPRRGKRGCQLEGADGEYADDGVRDRASGRVRQSICLRMKVGISMSLRS